MADLTLGLDLGSSSIGWALLDEANGQLVGCGVRVFPEGVDRDTKGGEVSKSEQRRIARGMRRQIARRARRKRQLRHVLVQVGLLPAVAALQREDPQRVEWERSQFNDADPYTLRARAVVERVEPHELGRILVQLNQRRGFKSNRKMDRARKKENSEVLAEISKLAEEIGPGTLGQRYTAMRGLDRKQFHLTRLRGQHTHRDMFEKEFSVIWQTQRPHYPSLLTEDLRGQIHRIMFFQRPMYWPKSVIGRCELDPRLPRCTRADRRAQRLRLLLEVNNLRVLDTAARTEEKLLPDQREKLIAYLSSSNQRTFDQIRKHLFKQHDGIRFNLEKGGREKLKGMTTDAALSHKSMLGKDWRELDDQHRDRIVSAIIDDNEERLRKALVLAGHEADLAPRLLEGNLEEGYSSYSLHAIKRLLPHVEKGLPLTSRDGKTPCALREAGFLMPWEHLASRKPFLPEPPKVTNPLVRKALGEACKVINAILRELVYRQCHVLKKIHIELAREVRGTAEQRRNMSFEMRDREKARDDAAERIREHGVKVTREAIDRYLLWLEQGKQCIYSDSSISIAQLFGGEVDLDHILPYRRSLDDSLMNKVVCFKSENSQGVSRSAKGDRTPYEWLAQGDPGKYEKILQRARRLPYPKLKRFYQQSIELDDFFARQFVDTTYITTQVAVYVRCLGAEILCPKGQHTAELRQQWGLNTVLRDDGADFKNRDDHRHHAVDAIVIALMDHSRLQKLAAIRSFGDAGYKKQQLTEPWQRFRASVEDAVNKINVSHRVRRKVSGALHEDTVYGCTDRTNEYVYRKPLNLLTPAMVLKIRDRAIRNLVLERLRAHGIEPKRGSGKIPSEVWKEELRIPPKKGKGQEQEPKLSGVPVHKVRILVPSESVRPIRKGKAFVQPGNTHHVCLFEITEPNGKTWRDAIFVTMLEAVERVKNFKTTGEPIIRRVHPTRPDAKFLMSLSGNEMVLLQHGGKEDLYRFETAASTSQQMWFRRHTAAGKSTDKRGVVSKKPNTFQGQKVTVDPLGRIRWAND